MAKKIQKIKRKNNNDSLYKSVKIAVPKKLLNKVKLDMLYEVDKAHTAAVNAWIDKYYDRTNLTEKILSGTATGIMQKESINIVLPAAYTQISGNKMLDILRSYYLNVQDKIASDIWRNKDFTPEYKYVYASFARNIKLFSRFINKDDNTEEVISTWKSGYMAKARELYYRLSPDEKQSIPALIRASFYEIREKWQKPVFTGGNIQLDYRVFAITPAENSTYFNLWVDITTLVPHKRISVPFKLTSFKEKELTRYFPEWQTIKRKGVLVIRNRHIHLSIPVAKEKPDNIPEEYIGVDIGMSVPISTDTGTQIGHSFTELVKEDYDRYLALQSTRNKIRALKTQAEKRLEITSNPATVIRLEKKLAEYNRHLLPNNWTELRNKIKSEVTTEIGRTVNVFIRNIEPSETLIIMEDLSDMNARGAKRTRRGKFELSSWAHGELQRHLEEDIAWHGGGVAYVVPEYTSQLCGKCGHLDEGNRQGKAFKCLSCGYTADADINAAGNIKERFFDTELQELVKKHNWNKDLRRQKIKELLLSRFKQKTA